MKQVHKKGRTEEKSSFVVRVSKGIRIDKQWMDRDRQDKHR